MDLRELKQLFSENNFRPNKRLGQNFLVDKNIRDKILSALPLDEDGIAVEVGSGFGVMTFALAKKCKKVIAIEKDIKICRIMRTFFEKEDNIELVNEDILNVDLCDLPEQKGSILIFGNIPYYISTPFIEKIIENKNCIKTAYIVIQKEVADRIVALPGSKTYSSLSCFVQYFTKVKKLFRVKKNSFYPKPRVESALLGIETLSSPSVKVKDEALMFRMIRKAFSQRRKKAVNPLSDTGFIGLEKERWERLFEECGLSPSLRAEDISLSDYARLADAVNKTLRP